METKSGAFLAGPAYGSSALDFSTPDVRKQLLNRLEVPTCKRERSRERNEFYGNDYIEKPRGILRLFKSSYFSKLSLPFTFESVSHVGGWDGVGGKRPGFLKDQNRT